MAKRVVIVLLVILGMMFVAYYIGRESVFNDINDLLIKEAPQDSLNNLHRMHAIHYHSCKEE